MEQSRRYVVIVAGGSGLRMGGPVPKQFMLLGGMPVLMRTVEAFARTCGVILVLPASHIEYWRNLCAEYRFDVPHQIAEGGGERFHSVANGLAYVPDDALVAVHDGVRPLVSQKVIDEAFDTAARFGTAIPVLPAVDSLRYVDGDTNRAVARSSYRMVQTPQVFSSTLLREAYRQPFDKIFTDDASVVEAMGRKVALCNGERRNIKITTPEDLVIAEALLSMD